MAKNLKELYDQLKVLDKKEFSYLTDIDYNANEKLSLRYKNALLGMNPEAIFCVENEPFILFFNLEKSTDIDNELKRIHKQSWNFDKAPIIIVSTPSDIVFYNAFNFDTNTHKLAELTSFQKDFQDFAYENLYNGSLFEIYKNKFIDNGRVNKLLFQHITDYREKLIKEKMDSSFANILLSRIIFLKYLKDRKISVDANNKNKIEESFESKEALYKLFKYLKKKFNGDLFDIDENEESIISDDYMEILQGFFHDNDINGQGHLFIPFDFAIIPIELISNIYEKFLNAKQDENQSYYTPTFLVDYIVNNTVSDFLDNANKKDSNCKILDPACGSGIFLIETLRKIIQKEEKLNLNKKITPQRLKELVENNIFGVDKDGDAINIAIFSLYITLLDYQDPKNILTFKFPHLKNTNFFVSDFFDCKNEFNLKLSGIDFILSNPPYGEIKEEQHINWFRNNSIPINDKQIAQSFLIRVRDFCTPKTTISMVVLSKILYNVKANRFRKYFLEKFKVKEIFELSAVRREIFNGAITPVAIFTYSYDEECNNLDNKFTHLTIRPNLFFKYFKVLLIEKNDRKIIEQKFVHEYDWLWKTLLYGNILDFHFIKRIIENYPSLNSINDKIISGKGIQFGGGDKQTTEHLIGIPFLDTSKKQLQQFKVNIDKTCKFSKNFVHRNRFSIKDIFKAPSVLIKKGSSSNFACVSAVTLTDSVFTDSVASIKFKDNDITKLYSLCGILNSNFFTYLILNFISAVAIERSQIHLKEYLNTPFASNSLLAETVKHLHELPDINVSLYTNSRLKNNPSIINADKLAFVNLLNQNVAQVFKLTESEEDLIDYALNISIPIWKYGDNINNKIKPFKGVTKSELKEYANIFINNFASKYKYFNIDVYLFKYCTLVNFKVREKQESKHVINFIKDSNLEDTIKTITNLSYGKITHEIYIKKDIKGFNNDSFFVLKTNEYKNWHKAIARLDVNEFANAIWEAEFELSKQ